MSSIINPRITIVWLLLIAGTLLSNALGHGFGFDSMAQTSIAIIVVAFIKVFFVIHEFMEVRHTPLLMKTVANVWLVAVCSVLIFLYLRSSGAA